MTENEIDSLLEKASISAKIDYAVQKELRFMTDNLTSKGWDFVEKESPALIITRIIDSGDDPEELTKDDFYSILQDIISDYHKTHPNIRYTE